MNLFLAWSGVRSYRLASALVWCIKEIFPKEAVSPFFSAEIEPGTTWFPALRKALAEADAILLCVTRENLRSPWMQFELGSRLAADSGDRVFAYLLDVDPGELSDPLRGYQAVMATQEGTRRLIDALAGSDPTSPEDAFARCWPELERRLRPLSMFSIEELLPGFGRLFQRKTFHEPMDECMDQSWLDRYYAARQTLDRLTSARESTDPRWQPFQVALLQELISVLDAYVREMRRFLLSEAAFERSQDGRLDLARQAPQTPHAPPGDVRWAEKRTETIRQLVTQLLDPHGAPVFADSVFFLALSPFWRKKDFVHRKEAELDAGEFRPGDHDILLAARSSWDLDRIVCYLAHESGKTSVLTPERLLKQAERELEKIQGRDDGESAMPLHYSLRAVAALPIRDREEPIIEGVRRVRQKALQLIEQRSLDRGGQMRDVLQRLG
jgi:TIR domain-containing protein